MIPTRVSLAIEKVATTYLEAWAALMVVAANGKYDLSATSAAAVAAIPAAANAMTVLIPTVPDTAPYWVKLLGNVVRTFGVTFLGYIGALSAGFTLDTSLLTAAGVAGLAAVFASLKGGLATQVGSRDTPNLTDAAPIAA